MQKIICLFFVFTDWLKKTNLIFNWCLLLSFFPTVSLPFPPVSFLFASIFPCLSFFPFLSVLTQLHTDMDRNDGRTKYVLRGEGAGSVFVIDEKTGNIHVTKPLDREEKDEYRLIATATDRQTDRALEPSSQFIIRVQDINDNPPVFDEGPYSATVPEMANIGTGRVEG